jgi:hypothetical protein
MTPQPGASKESGSLHQSDNVRDWFSISAVFLSLVLFAVSCFLPALEVRWDDSPQPTRLNGLWLLLNGWQGPLVSIWDWCANPLLLLSLFTLLFRRWSSTVVFGISALVLASGSLFLSGRYVLTQSGVWGAFDHGFRIRSVAPGYYAWLASIAVVGIVALIGLVTRVLRQFPAE